MTVVKLKTKKNTGQKRESFSLRSEGKTLLNTPYKYLATQCATHFFADKRSVSMLNNKTGKTVAHFIYGRMQDRFKG